MKIVVARFDSAKDFLKHYDPAFEAGGLRVPTKTVASPGEPLALQVSFPGSPSHVLLRSRAVGRDATQGSLVAAFISSERAKKDYLVACARGEAQAPWMRRHWRFPLQLRVSFGLANQPSKVEAFAEDISKGGMFVRTP